MTLEDYFVSTTHTKRFLWACDFARKINTHLDNGDIFFTQNGVMQRGRFVISMSPPSINWKVSDSSSDFTTVYLDEKDDSGKIWVRTKKEFLKSFEKNFHLIIPAGSAKRFKL